MYQFSTKRPILSCLHAKINWIEAFVQIYVIYLQMLAHTHIGCMKHTDRTYQINK